MMNKKKELGIEVFARKHRYVAFRGCTEDCLVLGHHADDQLKHFCCNGLEGQNQWIKLHGKIFGKDRERQKIFSLETISAFKQRFYKKIWRIII